MAALHLKKKREERRTKDIFKSIGPSRKALCARYDLDMRRQLNFMSTVRMAVLLPKKPSCFKMCSIKISQRCDGEVSFSSAKPAASSSFSVFKM